MKDRLNCVMDIGEQMLVSGAEVHRVEDSVGRMCRAPGAAHVALAVRLVPTENDRALRV